MPRSASTSPPSLLVQKETRNQIVLPASRCHIKSRHGGEDVCMDGNARAVPQSDRHNEIIAQPKK